MKLQEFQDSKCSYPANIPFAISWSDDDKVAMATSGGVYVTEIIPSVGHKEPELLTKRYFVPCSKSIPTRDCGVIIDDLITSLNQSETYSLVEDVTLSPAISKVNGTSPAVKQCAWSPIFCPFRTRCLLAVLTNRGALEIHDQWRNKSIISSIISKIWYDYCSSKWEKCPTEPREILAELKVRSYKLKLTAFSWGKYVTDNCCDFFVGTLDGTITVWKISIDLATRRTSALLVSHYETNGLPVTCITCHYVNNKNYILFVAYIDGTVKSFKCSNEGEKIIKENNLWQEADKLQICAGGMFCDKLVGGPGCYELVLYAMKGNMVLIIYVDSEGNLISLAERPLILHDLFISGFTPWTDNQYLLTTNSGNIFILSQKYKEASLSKFHDSVIRANHYSCYGICRSKNLAVVVLATSVRCNYDHLAVKDTGHMVWYSSHSPCDLTTLLSYCKGSSEIQWDLIETFRIDCIYNNTEIPWSCTSEEIDNLETVELKNHLALLQLSILVDTNRNINCEEKLVKEVEIKELILSCHIFKSILWLINEEKLDDFNMKSLMLMKKWLSYLLVKYSSKYRHTTTTATALQEQLNKFCANECEECVLCSSEVLNICRGDLAECVRGHRIPRCSFSLLQCIDVPYYSCRRCNVIVHPEAVSERSYKCLYCGNVLRISELFLQDDEKVPNEVNKI